MISPSHKRVVPLVTVSIFQDHVVELVPVEQVPRVLGDEHLVARDDDVVLFDLRLELAAEILASNRVARVKLKEVKAGGRLLELRAPRREDGERAHDEAGTGDVLSFLQVANQRNHLDRLPL